MTVQDFIVVVVLLFLAWLLEHYLVPQNLKRVYWAFIVLCLIVAALRLFGYLDTRIL